MGILTDKLIQSRGTGKDQWFSEDAPRGHGRFMLRITKQGERLFYFRYTGPKGERITFPIGAYDARGSDGMTLAEARTKAGQLSKLYQSGIVDIKGHLDEENKLTIARRAAEQARLDAEQAEKQKEIDRAMSRLTVSDLFDRWASVDLIRRKDGGAEVRRMFEKDVLPKIGLIAAEDVTKGHITGVTDDLLARGVARMAKQIFSLIRQMFRFAVDRDIVDADPSASIRKAKIGGKDVERDRFLSEEEIKLLADQIPSAKLLPSTEAAIWICLSTCCRIGELLQARWEHIDLDKCQWMIPADNSKNGKIHTIYLSNFAQTQFQLLADLAKAAQKKRIKKKADAPPVPWVYPNRSGENAVCLKTITKQIGDRQRVGKAPMSRRAKVEIAESLILPRGKWTPHDLRRTGATLMVASGILPEVAERCLNHTEQDRVKRTYQRHSYEVEMKAAWKHLGNKLDQIVTAPAGDNPHLSADDQSETP
ncbi:MAG: site-specific integrase [Betaproteobacteria bacterium]|nr:site-specific integrase [Betaproteobacteria bacterium]